MKLAIAIALSGVVVACSPTPPSGGTDAGPPCSTDAGTGVARTWTCSFGDSKFGFATTHATNCSDTDVQVNVAYSATESAAGDVLVNAIVDAPARPPALSSSASWTAGAAGADGATDTLSDDICQSGGEQFAGTWSFSLDKATSTLTSIYTDADLIAGSVTYTTPCTVDPPASAMPE